MSDILLLYVELWRSDLLLESGTWFVSVIDVVYSRKKQRGYLEFWEQKKAKVKLL